MSSQAARMKVLSMYKSLIRESQKFSSYNYRNYALRRIRDGFKDNKTMQDSKLIENELAFAAKNLEIIHRQVIVGHLYSSERLVIEKQID